jgi:glyoxylase-like metal-dependent hydrolase (beta-lactamase superfamily II)
VIIGDDAILVSDATATPALARDLIARIRTISDKPIKYVLLTHYHAVRVLGASAFKAEGATEVIASHGTLEMIRERGAQDMKSEMERFPRLFQGAEEVPDLAHPGCGRWQTGPSGQHPSGFGRRVGGDLAPRCRPHQGRHHRLGRERESALQR